MKYSKPVKATLFAGAVLGGAPAFAQSSVTLYGSIDDAASYVNNAGGHSLFYMRAGNLLANKFGLHGVENLGGGTDAIFDLVAGFNLNTGASASTGLLFNRTATVGLQNPQYGTFAAGRQYSTYLKFVAPVSSSNWLTGATGAHPADIDGLDTTIYVNNALSYTTPLWHGVQAAGMYALGGIAGSAGKGQTMSAALRYTNGPVSLAAAYLRMDNAQSGPVSPENPGFNSQSTTTPGLTALNQGYASARSVRYFASGGTYVLDSLTVGLTYSNVRYLPGGESIFADTAVFNTYAAFGVYRLTPAFDVGGGFAYTRASQANNISDAARYEQVSLKQAYHLSKRTTLYTIQGYQHATGQTLGVGGTGDIVNAAPAVGDSQSSTPSSTRSQFVGMVGITTVF